MMDSLRDLQDAFYNHKGLLPKAIAPRVDKMAQLFSAAIACAEAAGKRVAELEAELAATAWRPVTEPPTEDDEYLVWCNSYEGFDMYHYSVKVGWYAPCGNDPDYWQPLPPPPSPDAPRPIGE